MLIVVGLIVVTFIAIVSAFVFLIIKVIKSLCQNSKKETNLNKTKKQSLKAQNKPLNQNVQAPNKKPNE